MKIVVIPPKEKWDFLAEVVIEGLYKNNIGKRIIHNTPPYPLPISSFFGFRINGLSIHKDRGITAQTISVVS